MRILALLVIARIATANKWGKKDAPRFPRESFESDFADAPSILGSGLEFSLFGKDDEEEDVGGEAWAEDFQEPVFSEKEESVLKRWKSKFLGEQPEMMRTRHRDDDEVEDEYGFQTRANYASARSGRAGGSFGSSRSSSKHPSLFQPVTHWWATNISPNVKNWPKIQCRVEPTTTLKLRKTFRPLGTIVRLGANFNTQLGVWQFQSSWEDAIIGGKLTLAGRELQLTKSWQLSVGAVEDLVTRLRLRAAVDLTTYKAYARVGFRTERLSPINVMEGFTLQKQLPLDGPSGHVKLQVKANFALPEPEIEYSTESQRSLIGMGDIRVNIEELNLLLDY